MFHSNHRSSSLLWRYLHVTYGQMDGRTMQTFTIAVAGQLIKADIATAVECVSCMTCASQVTLYHPSMLQELQSHAMCFENCWTAQQILNVNIKVKTRTLDTAPLHENLTPKVLSYGSHSLPAHPHIIHKWDEPCLCLSSRSWYSLYCP